MRIPRTPYRNELVLMICGYLVFVILVLASILLLIRDRPVERCVDPREQGVPR